MKKNILILYSGAKYWGGIETYLANLFDFADKDQIELCFASLGEWPLTQKLQTTNHKLQKFSGKRMRIRTIFDVAKYLREENIDLVVSQGMVANFYARKASFLTKVPSLVVVHSSPRYDYPGFAKKIIYYLSDRFFRFATKRYIAVSESIENELMKIGISKEKITVIPNGIKAIFLGKVKDSGGFVFGSIGRLHKVKNYENLIKAISLCQDKRVLLKIWGEGEERKRLEFLINELGLQDRVILNNPEYKLEKVFGEIDFYIQPSFYEGFGLSVVEAMFAGKPVIATSAGNLKDILDVGLGTLINGTSPKEIAESMDTVLRQREKIFEKANIAQKEALEKYDLKKWADRTFDVFKKAAK